MPDKIKKPPLKGGVTSFWLPSHMRSLIGYIGLVQLLTKSLGGDTHWFRGHADADRPLVPGIFGRLLGDNLADKRVKKLRMTEVVTNLDFAHQAKARKKFFPSDNDLVGQLVVMRHYGLLSRLLDWSESPLTALFFAVENAAPKKQSPACVWVLDPATLNEKQWGKDNSSIYFSHASVPVAMASCAFDDEVTLPSALKEEEKSSAKRTEKVGEVAAFCPQHTIMRHMVQKAQFTIHHTPKALIELPHARRFVGRIMISFDDRKKILEELRLAGVSRDLLFPDLDNLANHLNAETKRHFGVK